MTVSSSASSGMLPLAPRCCAWRAAGIARKHGGRSSGEVLLESDGRSPYGADSDRHRGDGRGARGGCHHGPIRSQQRARRPWRTVTSAKGAAFVPRFPLFMARRRSVTSASSAPAERANRRNPEDSLQRRPATPRRRWFAPTPQGKTLITTRSREFGATGGVIDLSALGSGEAYELLTASRKPEGVEEELAARDLIAELGGHALALDVAGGALAELVGQRSFKEFLARIRAIDTDGLEAAAQLGEELPNGHERSIAMTLLTSIGLLDEPGFDFLRLAGVLAPGIIPYDLVDMVFEALGRTSLFGARVFLSRVLAHSLAEASNEGYLVHTLVARTIRLHDKRVDRKKQLRDLVIRALLKSSRVWLVAGDTEC
jgi:hypothetical protein